MTAIRCLSSLLGWRISAKQATPRSPWRGPLNTSGASSSSGSDKPAGSTKLGLAAALSPSGSSAITSLTLRRPGRANERSKPVEKVSAAEGRRCATSLQNIGSNAACNLLCRVKDRVARKMGVARRRLDVAVAEQLADHRQGLPERQRTGSEGVSEVVNSHAL